MSKIRKQLIANMVELQKTSPSEFYTKYMFFKTNNKGLAKQIKSAINNPSK